MYRSYSLDHLKRLCFIRRARELGFSLDEVRALLRLADDPAGSCEAAHDLACRHLARGRYYSLCHEDDGNDSHTLVNEPSSCIKFHADRHERA